MGDTIESFFQDCDDDGDLTNPKAFSRKLLDESMHCVYSAEEAAAANLSSQGVDRDSIAKIIADLKVNIEPRLDPESLQQLQSQKKKTTIPTTTPYTSKLLLLIFGKPLDTCELQGCDPVVDINAPILHGLYPLHLAILTPHPTFIRNLIVIFKAKLDVKCEDTASPFYGMTPLEMGLCVMNQHIVWTPQLPFHHFLSQFLQQKILLLNIRTLAGRSANVRELLFKLARQGKVIELAAMLFAIDCYNPNFPTTLYIPSTYLPPDHFVQTPVMLRTYLCCIISSLVKKGFHLPGKEGENCSNVMSQMTTVMKLLESAHRGDLRKFERGQPLTLEDSCGIPKESQDESWVNRYLNTSFFYIDPSLFQPRGIFNSLMPLGYNDRLHSYDGLDIKSDRDLTETILRELNGRKIEEVSYEDIGILQFNLGCRLRAKFKEEKTSTEIHNSSLPLIYEPEQKKCIEDWSSFHSVDLHPIRMIIEGDESDELKLILKTSDMKISGQDVVLNFSGADISAYSILGKICRHRATKCAVEFLSHLDWLNLNIQNCYGSFPLHDAAITLSYELVKLLVDHGAIRESLFYDPVTSLSISPLDYALERLSFDKYLINWSPKKSVFKLIITLCLPQMQEARETITFLAGAERASFIVSDAIFKAVKRGQVVSVAVLLLLARDRVLEDLSYFGNLSLSGPVKFTQAIMNELASLVNQEYALMGRKEHTEILQLCLEKKELMIYLLQMLEIFDRAGSALDLYLRRKSVATATEEQVSKDVANLLREQNFILNDKDTDTSDIKSLLEPEQVQLRANLEQKGECPEGIWFKPHRQQFCQCGRKFAHWTCTTCNVFQRITETSFSYSQRRDFSSHYGPLFHQPLRKILPEPTRFLSSSSKLNRKVEPQGMMIRTAKEKPGMWLHLQMMSNRVAGSVLVSMLKRRLRGV